MANLRKIVYLTEAQKAELFSLGSVTSNGTTITYNENDLYVTPDNSVDSIILNSTTYTPTNGVVNLGTVLTNHLDITGKADKVTSATSGNFAALDANGNLTDSGHKHSDYLTSNTTYVSSVNGNSGAVTITGLPSVTSSDNGKVLMVVDGQWTAVSLSQANGVNF